MKASLQSLFRGHEENPNPARKTSRYAALDGQRQG
jgi:hypothetical protein